MATELRRTLTDRDVAVITVGTVIGSGIFLTPGGVLRSSGSVGVSMLVWLGGGLLTLLGALTYAELGCSRPDAGGLYAYIRDAFGPATAFTFGWTLLVVIASGSAAILAVGAADNLAAVMPLGEAGKKVVAVGIIAALAVVNVRGTRLSANALGIATLLKVSVLALLIVALPLAGTGWSSVTTVWPAQVNGPVFSGGLLAMVSVLWAYEGWQYATYIGGEVVDPHRNFPRGLVVGAFALVVIYVLTNLGYLAALGPERVARSTAVASESMGAVFGRSRVPRHGERRRLLRPAGRGPSAIRHPRRLDRRVVGVERGAGALRHVQHPAHLRGLRGVDLLRTGRSVPHRVSPARARPAAPHEGAGLPGHPDSLRALGRGDRDQHHDRQPGSRGDRDRGYAQCPAHPRGLGATTARGHRALDTVTDRRRTRRPRGWRPAHLSTRTRSRSIDRSHSRET
jgi:hypothetical protein